MEVCFRGMPELQEQLYCSQQIIVPAKYPYILKKYAKAAIKTQPYDLLRWSYEYFRAVAEGRPPPVKLRLEYPVYSTEGGLTRGYLKVLANQLAGFDEVPISKLQEIWEGSCLDVEEFKRILCLADAFMRSETVSRLKFLAIAAGLLTKSLTHTMILLCETLTGGPEGGSAAVPVDIFLEMYKCLAYIDASKEVTYYNGWREGLLPVETPPLEEEEGEGEKSATTIGTPSSTTDDFWEEIEEEGLTKIHLTDERVAKSNKISMKLEEPVIGRISRTPSVERDAQREMENILKECRGYVVLDSLKYLLVSLKKKLRQMSTDLLGDTAEEEQEVEPQTVVRNDDVELHVYDEDCNQCQLEFYGEPPLPEDQVEEEDEQVQEDGADQEVPLVERECQHEKIAEFVKEIMQYREQRVEYVTNLFKELAAIVHKYETTNYDLGVIAGRQMSYTSGEFIVKQIQRDMMAQIGDIVEVLPDPSLRKRKAKPEEVQMIRRILEDFLDENMDAIVPEEEVEEEEKPVPQVVVVHAVPGIGPPVDVETVSTFVEYAVEISKVQADCFMPRNIRHFMCPPLESHVEVDYQKPDEELPTDGAMTV